MALSVVRKGVTAIAGCAGRSLVIPNAVIRPQVATIVSKTMRPQDYKRPYPYPYHRQTYGFIEALFDKTTFRMDENSKIIVVDGPIGVNRAQFAKEAAEELDMLYVPQANMDMHYINSYGYDMRQLDPQLPESCKSFDEKDFLTNPYHLNATAFQFKMLSLRLNQYIDALAHVLSTGQGVVMDRCVYSDMVFAEAMAQFGYMRKKALSMYYKCREMTLPQLMRPHLVIYLDVPVDVSLQRIKERNLPHEVNSPVLSREYLSHMEYVYKQQYLKQMAKHAQILLYDWSDEGDAEVVVEDIERVNFEFGKNEPLMSDWKLSDEWAWCGQRMQYTKFKYEFFKWLCVPDFSVTEMVIPAEDAKILEDVYSEAPGCKFDEGFNSDMGDGGLETKVRRDRVQ